MTYSMTRIFVILCLSLISANGRDFCESYERNDNRIVVHSQDFHKVFLIIDKHLWTLTQNNNTFEFEDKSGTEERGLKIHYSFSFSFHTKSKEKIIVFHLNDMSCGRMKCPHQYRLNGKVLEYWHYQLGINFIKNQIKFRPFFAFAVNDDQSIGFVGQTFDKTAKTFERNFTYLVIVINLPEEKGSSPSVHLGFSSDDKSGLSGNSDPKIKEQLEKLETIDNKIEMIGVFMNLTNDTTVFLRFNRTIKYCSVDECLEKKFNILIDCTKSGSEPIEAVSYAVLIVIFVFILVIGMMGVVVCFCRKGASTVKTANTGEEDSVKTVKTINSDTGIPLDQMSNLRSDTSLGTVRTKK